MTQFNAPTYDIQRPSGQCAITGRKLEPGEPYMAALVEVDPGQAHASSAASGLGLGRLDISMEAWASSPRPPRIFSYWKSVVPQPNQKRRLFVDDEVLLNIFRRLADDPQPQRQAFRFVIGLILMRKKVLRYDGTLDRPNGDNPKQSWWQMIPKGENQPLEMLDPRLDEEKIQQVKEQLSEVLAGEL